MIAVQSALSALVHAVHVPPTESVAQFTSQPFDASISPFPLPTSQVIAVQPLVAVLVHAVHVPPTESVEHAVQTLVKVASSAIPASVPEKPGAHVHERVFSPSPSEQVACETPPQPP